MTTHRMFPICLAALIGTTALHDVHAQLASSSDLKRLSLEELMNVEVTLVSRRPERLLEAPAAIQVITAEEIRRSGASNLASVLRLASNLNIARKNAHEWIISARGFSSDVGNKLLVMIDGRTVYTPLFSGVFWDRQDYLLEDIERIEVVSGPGGSLWGANAVNGVINIVTRSAQATRGLYMEAGGGEDPRGFGALRYGGELAGGAAYRVYAKYSDMDSQTFANGLDAGDDWRHGQSGFRIDKEHDTDTLTLQGDYYKASEGINAGGDGRVWGVNLLGRWSHRFSDRSDTRLQVYYDRTHLVMATAPVIFAPAGTFGDDLATWDVDFQHNLQLGDRHRLAWGLGVRLTRDHVSNSPGLAFYPERLDQQLYNGFVQDEVRLRDDLTLTLGTRVEHTDYTGFEVEPNARMQWTVSPQQSLWGAVSRAVRTPSRVDRDISQPAPGYLIVILEGGRQFESETLLAWELGYRAQLGSRATLSLSTFYNEYDKLRSTSLGAPDPLFGLPFPFYFENNLEGETHGFELTARYQVLDGWRLQAGFNLLRENLRVKPGETDFNNALNETADPEQQFALRSSVNLPNNIELDTDLRWVGERIINDAGVATTVPEFWAMDLRLGWRPTKHLQLSLVGRDLLDRRHPEYAVPDPTRVEIERSFYGKVAWNF